MSLVSIGSLYRFICTMIQMSSDSFIHIQSEIQDNFTNACSLQSCKKFCHWVRITSVLRFIKHIFITNLQSTPPLLKHIFVTFLPSREKQINSLLLVSIGEPDK